MRSNKRLQSLIFLYNSSYLTVFEFDRMNITNTWFCFRAGSTRTLKKSTNSRWPNGEIPYLLRYINQSIRVKNKNYVILQSSVAKATLESPRSVILSICLSIWNHTHLKINHSLQCCNKALKILIL